MLKLILATLINEADGGGGGGSGSGATSLELVSESLIGNASYNSETRALIANWDAESLVSSFTIVEGNLDDLGIYPENYSVGYVVDCLFPASGAPTQTVTGPLFTYKDGAYIRQTVIIRGQAYSLSREYDSGAWTIALQNNRFAPSFQTKLAGIEDNATKNHKLPNYEDDPALQTYSATTGDLIAGDGTNGLAGRIYKCITNTSGAFNPAHWELDDFNELPAPTPAGSYVMATGGRYINVSNEIVPAGVTYTQATGVTTGYVNSIAINPTTGRFVAARANTSQGLYYSNDGINWFICTGYPAITNWYNVIWTGSEFIATGNAGIARSTDGINWTTSTLPAGLESVWWGSIASGGGVIVVGTDFNQTGAGVGVIKSIDGGVTFTLTSMTTGKPQIIFNSGRFIYTSFLFSTGYGYSNDGNTWTQITTGVYTLPYVGKNGDIIIASNNTGGAGNGVLRSTDNGLTYSATGITNGSYSNSGIYYDSKLDAYFLAQRTVSIGLQISTDNLATKTLVNNTNPQRILRANSILVYTTSTLTYYSYDGVTWTQATTGLSQVQYALVYLNKVVMGTITAGVYYSEDTFLGDISGNATTITINPTGLNENRPVFFANQTAAGAVFRGNPNYDTDLTYNPSTNTLNVGVLNPTTALAVNKGGTGRTDGNNLIQNQTGATNKFLYSNGTINDFATIGAGLSFNSTTKVLSADIEIETFLLASTNETITFDLNANQITRVGNLVTCTLYFYIDTTASTEGVILSGIPTDLKPLVNVSYTVSPVNGAGLYSLFINSVDGTINFIDTTTGNPVDYTTIDEILFSTSFSYLVA